MIERVEIEQFQNHTKTDLDFSPGLNIICGQSDNGKSAVIRAINWVLTNKPSGSAFCKVDNEGVDTKVKLTFTDGEVLRVRGHKKNHYIFDGTEYKAMRSDVPEEIAEFANIGDQNIQGQFASHFLISESSGEVARTLNSIVGLEDIDKAHKVVGRIIAESNANIKFLKAEFDKYTERMRKFDDLDTLDEQLQGLERIQKNIAILEDEVEEMTNVVSNIHQIMEGLEEAEKTIEFEEKISSLLAAGKNCSELENELVILQKHVREIILANQTLASGMDIIREEDGIRKLLLAYEQIEDEEPEALVSLINDISLTLSTKKGIIDGYDKAVKEYEDEFKKQKICPLCERSM